MSIGTIIFGAFFFILIIVFFVVVWKASPDWRWYQIVAAVFCMIFSIVLVFPTAQVLKSRAAWHKKKEELEDWLTRIKIEQEEIKYGDPTVAGSEGIVQLTQRLSKLGVEAGRRWRGLTQAQLQMTPAKLTRVTLNRPQPAVVPGLDPAAGDAAPAPAAATQLIPEGLVVYGFAELETVVEPTQQLKMRIPRVFLGEFRVQTSGPNQVILQSISSLRQEQNQLIQQTKSWSVYETLPLDSHLPFVAAGSPPSEDRVFGAMNEELIRSLLGNTVSQETIDQYVEDGRRGSNVDDPPENLWVKVQFQKRFKMEVDNSDPRPVVDGMFFDGNGRALDARLHVGGDGSISFDVDDQVLLKEDAAKELLDDETVKLIDRYFIRELNDYRYVLHRIRLQLAEDAIRKQEMETEHTVLKEMETKTIGMTAKNQDAKLKLEQDLGQIQIERQSIEKYATDVAKKLKAMRDRTSALHRKNQELEMKLQRYHREIENRVESLSDREASLRDDSARTLISK